LVNKIVFKIVTFVKYMHILSFLLRISVLGRSSSVMLILMFARYSYDSRDSRREWKTTC